MSIKTGLLIIFVAIFALIGGSLYVVSLAVDNEGFIARAETRRYESYKLADELRQSSDDLTRMARTFVVTGDERYKSYFDQIVAIRDGNAPRPLDYGNIYWDFVVASGNPPRFTREAAALESLMREAQFTEDELALLQHAKERSDALIALEEQAMQAVRGRFLDDTGRSYIKGPPNMELARRLMHGQEYHRAKSEIMAPIEEFFRKIDARTAAEIMRLRRRGKRLNVVAIVGLGTAVVLVLISFVLVARQPLTGLSYEARFAGASIAEERGRKLRQTIWTGWPLLTASVVACVSVLSASWWLSESIEERVHSNVRSALQAVHQTTARSVEDWLTSIVEEVRLWARLPAVRRVLEEPASAPGRSPWPTTAQTELGDLLAPLRSERSFAGYLVLDPNGRVVASDDVSLLRGELGGVLGETFFSELKRPPNYSTVALPVGSTANTGDDSLLRQDMLVATAALNGQEGIVGLLALRVNPRLDFSRILQRGRLGESGETYAFSRAGQLIRESRFDDQLRQIKLIGPGQRSGLNVELRDPGVDLTARGRAVLPRGRQPFTRMAQAALAGRAGVDLSGYRDYRGVPVIGAWTWNEQYGFGVATEVDVQEAYGVLFDYQRQTQMGTGLAIVLIIGLTGLFAWNRLGMAAANAKLETAYGIIRGQKDRMEQELNVGREIQMSMVPLKFPAFPEHDEFSVYAKLKPAREVGGDFYDFYFVDEKRFFFCVGDVSDKGVPAALFMAVTKTLIKSRTTDDRSTASILTHVNNKLSEENSSCMFVTLLAGILDITSGELVYTNAGHNPPYLRRTDGSVERLDQRHGPLAGEMPGIVYGESRALLAPGDLLLLYTDGVTEAMNDKDELFTEERLVKVIGADGPTSTNALVDRTVSAVETFERGTEQTDDITVLALQFLATSSDEAGLTDKFTVRNHFSELSVVDDKVDAFAAQCKLPTATTSKLKLIFDELLNNIISYAYTDDAEHEIEICLEVVGHRLVVSIADDGLPFNPLTVEPPDTNSPLAERQVGGLGIHLVRNLVDEATYQRRVDRNVLTLVTQLGTE